MVDKDLLPIIDWLWDFDILTKNSCQDLFGKCWIEFATTSDEAKLLDMAQTCNSGSIADFVQKWVSRTEEYCEESEDESDDGSDGSDEPSVSWRFPADKRDLFYDTLVDISCSMVMMEFSEMDRDSERKL
jgi:hypothetical protein